MKRESINPNAKLMNCINCGRDTRAKTGYCNRCVGHGPQIDDRKDRHVFKIDGDPLHQQTPFTDDINEIQFGE